MTGSSGPAISTAIRRALIKLLVAVALLIAFVFCCFLNIEHNFVIILASITAFLGLPIVISLSIDASREIKREVPSDKRLRILGFVLGIPQAVNGAVLLVFGIVYPFFGIHDIVSNIYLHQSAILPLVRTVFALMMLYLGYHYLREGFSHDSKNDLSFRKNIGERTEKGRRV